jgi:class 3 adenylate cyclase
MTAQIFASAGTADKCMGDAMFAVFSVPMAVPDDARNLGGLAEWNFERTNKGETPLAIGIGLNYGDRRHGQHRSPIAGIDPGPSACSSSSATRWSKP